MLPLASTSISHNVHVAFDRYTPGMDDNYHAYLARFKRREGQASWCATLENVHTREEIHFPTELELLVYLLQKLKLDGSPHEPDDTEKA